MIELSARFIVILVAACAVASLAAVSATTQPDRRGWRSITPSAMHWTALVLSFALTGLMSYIFLFIGSTRVDAAHQMNILFWLIVAFGLGTLVAAVAIWLVRRCAIRWRGDKIAFAGVRGEETRLLSDIAQLKISLMGSVFLCFRDSTTIRLDPYASGAAELIERISGMLQSTKDLNKD